MIDRFIIKYKDDSKKSVTRNIAKKAEVEVLEIINNWNTNPDIHGILVQLPLPKHINETKVLLNINPSKDVDGFHPENIGRLVTGLPTYVPLFLQFFSQFCIFTNLYIVLRINLIGYNKQI